MNLTSEEILDNSLYPTPASRRRKNSYAFLKWRIALKLLLKGKVSVKKVFNLFYGWLAHRLEWTTTATYPFMINFELSNECNAQCTFCRTIDGEIYNQNPNEGSGEFIPKGQMSLEMYKEVIDQVKDHLLIAVLYVNGEPLMYKDLSKALKYASERKVATIIATNGEILFEDKIRQLLDSGLDFIKIAISGFTQDIYTVEHRNGNIENVKANLRNLARLKSELNSDLVVMLDFIDYDYNEHQKDLVRGFAEELGFIFNTRPGNLFKLNEERPDLFPEEIPSGPKLPLTDLCEWPWKVMTVNWNGDLLPCCDYVVWNNVTPYATMEVGKTDLAKVWNGPDAADNRKTHTTVGRAGIDICSQCPRTGTAFKY